ncbi:DUF998 domain-containing protein [Brachybacterium hainanense]|uniref:DUF998 domain-containing protein n=1 Tax=Brachybacterium hainanense TaxID=1541174 RepID=A0ABV6RAE8_9MICO
MGMRRRRGLLRATGAVAALAYAGFLLDAVAPGRHDWGSLVSELESPGRPFALVLRTADVASAVLAVALVPALGRLGEDAGGRGRWAARLLCGGVLVFGAGEIGAALVPLPAGVPDTLEEVVEAASEQVLAHNALSVAAIAGLLASGLGAVLLLGGRPCWLPGTLGLLGAGVAVSVAGDLLADRAPALADLAGVGQRVQILAGSVWLVGLGALAARAAPGERA